MSLSIFGVRGRIMADNGVLQPAIVYMDRTLGIITSIESGNLNNKGDVVDFGDALIAPGDTNAHSHPEQSIYVDMVKPDWNLATWCKNTIYKYSVKMTPTLIYLSCARAFSRMMMYGTTSVAVSYYCHNRRGNDLDRAVLQAAKDTGIRLYFGRMNYDIVLEDAYPEKKASQASYFETPEIAENRFMELFRMEGREAGSRITIAPALHSFHANTLDAIIRGIRLGVQTNRLVQFHLSEDNGDVDICLSEYEMRPVEVLAHLKKDGKVPSLDCLILSDSIWLSDHEKDLIAEHGMKVVLNPRMNDRVKAGRANLYEYLKRGVPVWVGTDGEASNDDLSMVHEREYLSAINPDVPASLFAQVGEHPFPFEGPKTGKLKPGYAADIKVSKGEDVKALYIAATSVLEEGKLLTLDVQQDIEEPLAQECMRAGITA